MVAALALALAFLNTAPLLALLRREFGLTNFQAGALAAATLLSHTALQLPAGPLVDQLGSRRATLVGLGVVAVGVLLSGQAPSFPALLLARLAVGVGTGLAFLAALVLAAEAVPPARAPWQQSLYGAAFQAGTLLTLALTPVLADRVGWRGAFLSEGAAIGLVALAGRRLLPVPRYARPRVPVPWALVFRAPGVYALGLAHVATYGTVTAVSAWAPTWLLDRYHLPTTLAGLVTGLMTPGAVLGRLLGGHLAARTARDQGLLLGAGLLSLLTAAVLPAGLPFPVVLGLLFGLGLVSGLSFGALFSRAARLFGPGTAGTGSGAVNFIANLGALAFPPLVGALLDRTGSYLVGFWCVAGLGLLGLGYTALYLQQTGPGAPAVPKRPAG